MANLPSPILLEPERVAKHSVIRCTRERIVREGVMIAGLAALVYLREHEPARAGGRRHFYGPLPSFDGAQDRVGSLHASKPDRLLFSRGERLIETPERGLELTGAVD